jgi:alkylation response protein AidB-like acyl-CoA dehydrogenase
MDFDFSDEQFAFRDSVRAFLAGRPAPSGPGPARPSDATSQKLWGGLAELGIFSVLVPEIYGGLGLTGVDLALVVEEFGRALMPPLVMETLIATDLISRLGSDRQKSALLPDIAAGRLRLSCAVAEALTGYDPANISTAIAANTGKWRLNGAKLLVPDAAAADLLVVTARMAGTSQLALVVLERIRGGVQLREQNTLDLMSPYHEVCFADVAVDAGDLLGSEAAPESVQLLYDAGAVSAAATMTGIAGRVMDTAVEFVKQRNQFGRPIGSFQAIKHKCADMAVAVESSRSAAYYAAWSLAWGDGERRKAVSIAKSFCGEASRLVCNDGIQLHGGMGFTWDLGLHHYLRRAKQLEYSYGDATFHRRRVLEQALREL